MIEYTQMTFAEEYLSGNQLKTLLRCGSDRLCTWVKKGMPFIPGPNRARLFLLSEAVPWIQANDPNYEFKVDVQLHLDRVTEFIDG